MESLLLTMNKVIQILHEKEKGLTEKSLWTVFVLLFTFPLDYQSNSQCSWNREDEEEEPVQIVVFAGLSMMDILSSVAVLCQIH